MWRTTGRSSRLTAAANCDLSWRGNMQTEQRSTWVARRCARRTPYDTTPRRAATTQWCPGGAR